MASKLMAILLFVTIVDGINPSTRILQTGHFVLVKGNHTLEKLELEQDEITSPFWCACLCLKTPRCNALSMRESDETTECQLMEVDRRFISPDGKKIYTGAIDDYEPCQADYVMGYPDHLLPNEATTFDDRPFGLTKRITAINIWCGYVVDRIQLVYDGIAGPSRGAPLGGSLQTMPMREGEFVTKVIVWTHDGDPYSTLTSLIGKIILTTNMGSRKWFGWGGGAGTFTLQGSQLRWISGVEGNRLYRINFAFMDSCDFVIP